MLTNAKGMNSQKQENHTPLSWRSPESAFSRRGREHTFLEIPLSLQRILPSINSVLPSHNHSA